MQLSLDMRQAAGVDDMQARPLGSYLAGDSFLYWCSHPTLFGIILWGRPSAADMRNLARALLTELRPGVVPHRSLVDGSRVESVDADAFAQLNQYVVDHAAELRERVQSLAMVRPGGLPGAVMAGFYQVLDSPYPVQVFDDAASAVAWLGAPADAALLSKLDKLVDQLRQTDPLVTSLRGLLVEHPADLAIERAAQLLGVSERTLQRRLQDAGTTFLAESSSVRLKQAQQRMLDTDAPLTVVALDAGFSTLQHFSASFRKATGESPSAWRARHRGGK